MCEILQYLTWENVKSFANSAFTTSLAGALAGAFAGAYAAQRIVERAKERELLLGQLRNSNAAITTAFSVCNTMIGFKGQQVKEIASLFEKQKAEFIAHHHKAPAGEGVEPMRLQVDLRMLDTPRVPVEILQTLIFERISVVGRPLALVSALIQVVDSLGHSVTLRNDLIEKFKGVDPNTQPEFCAIYFGLPFGGGHIDQQHSDTVTAISRLTDDAIFFSELIAKDMHEYGETVLAQYKKVSRDKTLSVSSCDFSAPRNAGLMPNDDNYQSWLKGFPKKADATT
jgi:hypothetical protein